MSGETQVMGTTKFVDDATVAKRDESMIAHLDNTILSMNDTQQQQQDLIAFLQKPLLIKSGSLGIGVALGTPEFAQYFPSYAFNTASQRDVWRNKLVGIFGIRMDMRFRLVINANRMQQGRYIMGWVPLAGGFANQDRYDSVVNMHVATLVQRTTNPHVEIDFATGTAAELLIPYTSVNSFYPLNTLTTGTLIGTLGQLHLYPYSTLLVPSGSTVVNYSIYMNFENIRLFGACSPQSGVSDMEVSNKSNGPLSSVSSAVSRGFNEFKNIPLLGNYAQKVSWIADRITSSAKMFGFSKPTAGDSIPKMQMTNCPAHTTVDGDSDARTLSYLSKPGTVGLHGHSGTEFDEMDFSYIVRKFAWFDTQSWVVGSASGFQIASYFVAPNVGKFVVPPLTNWTPVGFVGNHFQLWRGSLKFKIKLVKTEFHSGRLEVCFFPIDEVSYVGNTAYINRQIVDIRTTTEMEFVVPYMSREPWSDKNNATGTFVIKVVDPLVCPANVTPSVGILVEMAGGDDIEFAVPGVVDLSPSKMIPQSGECEDDGCIIKATIGSSSVSANPHIFSSTTIGDKVTNFRAYLKRYHPIRPNNKVSTSTKLLNDIGVTMYPDVIYASTYTPDLPTSSWNSDLYGTIASCYAMSRGGIRIRDIISLSGFSQTNVTTTVGITTFTSVDLNQTLRGSTVMGLLSVSAQPTSVSNPLLTQTTGINYDTNNHINCQQTYTNNVLSMEIPQYTKTYARATVDLLKWQGDLLPQNDVYYAGTSGTLGRLQITLPSGLPSYNQRDGYTVHNLHRAMADDGSFSVFISIPPMRTNTLGASFGGYY